MFQRCHWSSHLDGDVSKKKEWFYYVIRNSVCLRIFLRLKFNNKKAITKWLSNFKGVSLVNNKICTVVFNLGYFKNKRYGSSFSSVPLALHSTTSVNKLVQRHSHIFELNCNYLFNKEDAPDKCWLISLSLFLFSSPRSAEFKILLSQVWTNKTAQWYMDGAASNRVYYTNKSYNKTTKIRDICEK